MLNIKNIIIVILCIFSGIITYLYFFNIQIDNNNDLINSSIHYQTKRSFGDGLTEEQLKVFDELDPMDFNKDMGPYPGEKIILPDGSTDCSFSRFMRVAYPKNKSPESYESLVKRGYCDPSIPFN